MKGVVAIGLFSGKAGAYTAASQRVAMDGDPPGTEARDDQGALAAHARPAPLLCLDRGGTAPRRRGVTTGGVPSRQFARNAASGFCRGPAAGLARRRGSATPIHASGGTDLRPQAGVPGLVPPFSSHPNRHRGGGSPAGVQGAQPRLRGPGCHARRALGQVVQTSSTRVPGHSPRGGAGGTPYLRGRINRTDGLDSRAAEDDPSGCPGFPIRNPG